LREKVVAEENMQGWLKINKQYITAAYGAENEEFPVLAFGAENEEFPEFQPPQKKDA